MVGRAQSSLTPAPRYLQAEMLRHVANVPGLVRLVHSNQGHPQHGPHASGSMQLHSQQASALLSEPPFLVTSPFGRCLEIGDDAGIILGAAASAAKTVGELAKLEPPVLHRDLSLGNIIVLPEDLEQAMEDGGGIEAYLLDLATARRAPGGQLASTSCLELTGTPLFMAISILEGGPHTVSSDLESLFLLLVFLGCRGHVHWANARPEWREAGALKLLALTPGELFFEKYVHQRCRPDLFGAVQRLQKLFFVPSYNREVTVPQFLSALNV